MSKYLLLILLLLNPFQDSEWILKKDKNGIEVYTRSKEGSSFSEFKAITIITNRTLPEVLDVLLDVENYESIFPDCVNPEILKQDGKYYDIHYMLTKGPFPVKDRDSVFEQITEVDKNGKHAFITLNPLPDYIPEKEGIVRVRNGSGYWDLTEDDNKNVTVIHQFHGEPGGDVPAWLANNFVVSHPFKTFENLKRRLK